MEGTISAGNGWARPRACGLLDALRDMEGVLAAEPLDAAEVEELIRAEESITRVSGGLRLDNRGARECAAMGRCYAMFCDAAFPRPDEVTMEMVYDAGTLIGHDVPPSMRGCLEERDDVVWMSDGFVLYPGRVGRRDATLVMLSGRLDVPWPGEVRVFYPSMSTADALMGRFGVSGTGVAAVLVGADPGRVSSCDRCGGGSRWTGRPW